MSLTVDISQHVNPAEALWDVFQSQSQKVKAEFLKLLHREEQLERLPRHHTLKYSDAELDSLLSDCPMVHEDAIPELSDDDYQQIVKNMAYKPNRHVEKWL